METDQKKRVEEGAEAPGEAEVVPSGMMASLPPGLMQRKLAQRLDRKKDDGEPASKAGGEGTRGETGDREDVDAKGGGTGGGKEDEKKKEDPHETAVKKLIAECKFDEALAYICKAYGWKDSNFTIKVVPAMDDAWAKTGGEIKEGAHQTLSIGKDLFNESYPFIVRTIGHEVQHLRQRSQKDPIQNQAEREFLAWAWEALDKSVPEYPLQKAAEHAEKALEYYEKMPEDRKKKYPDKKKELEQLIQKAKNAKSDK